MKLVGKFTCHQQIGQSSQVGPLYMFEHTHLSHMQFPWLLQISWLDARQEEMPMEHSQLLPVQATSQTHLPHSQRPCPPHNRPLARSQVKLSHSQYLPMYCSTGSILLLHLHIPSKHSPCLLQTGDLAVCLHWSYNESSASSVSQCMPACGLLHLQTPHSSAPLVPQARLFSTRSV